MHANTMARTLRYVSVVVVGVATVVASCPDVSCSGGDDVAKRAMLNESILLSV